MDVELKEFSGATPYNNLEPGVRDGSFSRNKYRMYNSNKGNSWRCVAIVAVVLLILAIGGFGIYYMQVQKQELKQQLDHNLLKHSHSQSQELQKLNQALLKQDLTHWMNNMQNSMQQLHTVSDLNLFLSQLSKISELGRTKFKFKN